MNCPLCDAKGYTTQTYRASGTLTIRTRVCPSGHTFRTYESRERPRVARKAKEREAKRKADRKANPEKWRAIYKREQLRRMARVEANETGEDLESVYTRWGVPSINQCLPMDHRAQVRNRPRKALTVGPPRGMVNGESETAP